MSGADLTPKAQAHLASLKAARPRYVPAREVELRDLAVIALREACEQSRLSNALQLRATLAQASVLLRELDELHDLALGITVREVW